MHLEWELINLMLDLSLMIKFLNQLKTIIRRVEGPEEMEILVIVFYFIKLEIEKFMIFFKAILVLNKIIKILKIRI